MLLLQTALVRAAGLLQFPLMAHVRPRVIELDDEGCLVEIPLRRRTTNYHLHGMYFGALTVGADLAAGLNAASLILRRHRRVGLVFKDFQAEFFKRAESDVYFRCSQGPAIALAVAKADAEPVRVTIPLEVIATCPDKLGQEPVARFTMGLSLKRR